MKTFFLAAMAALVLTSCTNLPVDPGASNEVEKPEVPASTPEFKLPWGDRPAWSAHLLKETRAAAALLDAKPADVGAWCPTYASLSKDQRAGFYATLIAEAARWESSFKPETNVYECRKEKCVYGDGCRYVEGRGYCMTGGHKLDGGLVISRGLMQMSLQSAQGIGCPVTQPSDLNDPLKNLSCAVRGFQRYIVNGGQLATKVDGKWKGAAAYWAVFRGTTDYTLKARAAIQAAGKKFCAR